MDNETDKLLQVEGIGKKKLVQIKKSWQEQKAVKDIMLFLQSFDISPAYALKILPHLWKRCHKNSSGKSLSAYL